MCDELTLCTYCTYVLCTYFGFPAIGGVILHIINTCLIQFDIPDSWKHSIVHPLFKTGKPSDPANFRPITLVPVIMKVVERTVHHQLYTYLSHNHLLAPFQRGFRPRHSTETALLSVSEQILAATDSVDLSLLCLLDLSKCFDVIDHDFLIQKLMLYFIEISWFAAYLHGHRAFPRKMHPDVECCLGLSPIPWVSSRALC